ncbi:MAG TPA: acyltransferase family protein [Ornithinibacter sp.]|nr:acyltransferase family protein [Ornithinibacter sp.]
MPTTDRLDGLDAARGLAVVSMLVAHLSPVKGALEVSEYLTAPLFAVVIGIAMGVQLTERRPPAVVFLRDNLQRGLVLIVLGVLLQAAYDQILVVLPYLGVLILVLAPSALLLHRMPVLTLGLAAALAVVGPLAVERARDAVPDLVESWPAWAMDLLGWAATGESYRLVSFLPMALGGLALASVLRRAADPPEGYLVAGALFVLSVAAYALGRGTADGAAPYSGTTAEVVGGTFLATATVVASCVAVALLRGRAAGGVLVPLLSTGRLALTAYTLQILFLAAVQVAFGPVDDDSWLILASTTLVVVGGCWLLERRFGTGPLEWVVHRLRPPSAPPSGPTAEGAGAS